MNKSHFLILLCTAVLVHSLPAQTDPYAALSAADSGKDTAARATIEAQIRQAGPAGYAEVEAKLLKALAQPGVTPACQKFVCDTLRIIGSAACVEPLAKLFAEEATADLARLALEPLPGKAVDEALIRAAQAATGRTRIGLIQTLAARHNPGWADLAPGWLASGDAELARVTLLALGRCGCEHAIGILKAAQVAPELAAMREGALVDAAFLQAQAGNKDIATAVFQEEFRSGTSLPAVIAALNGLVDVSPGTATPLLAGALKDARLPVAQAAARASVRVKDAAQTKELAQALPGLLPAMQVATLRALALRGDKAALAAVAAALGSAEETVKTEAALALETLGDSSLVDELVTLASGQGAPAAAAQQTLARLTAPGVREALTAMLDAADPGTVRVAALTLRARADHSALPRLLQMMSSEDATLRATALEALDGLAGTGEMPALLGLLRNASDRDRDKAASALWKATRSLGSEDERFKQLWAGIGPEPEPVKAAILSLANVAGGAESMAILQSTLTSSSDLLKDAAVRTLCNWPNDLALNALPGLITSTENTKHRILATRALVRILNDRKCGWAPGKKVETLQQLLPVMTREDEKKMIGDALAKFGAPAK